MRSLFYYLLLGAVTAGSTLTGCRHDAEPAPASLPGFFSGAVTVQDESGQPESAAGVSIALKGGPTALTATTDATGRFEFKNLPLGTYEAVYTRSDLGTSFAKDIVLDAQRPTSERMMKMGKPATTSVTSFTLTGPVLRPNTIPYTLQVDYNPAIYPSGFRYMIYLSNKASVSNTDYVAEFYGSATSGARQTQLWFTLDEFKNKGFATGSTVYLVAYGATATPVSYPGVTVNGITSGILSNLNPVRSSVVTFVMP